MQTFRTNLRIMRACIIDKGNRSSAFCRQSWLEMYGLLKAGFEVWEPHWDCADSDRPTRTIVAAETMCMQERAGANNREGAHGGLHARTEMEVEANS